jgi:hypothetical protein
MATRAKKSATRSKKPKTYSDKKKEKAEYDRLAKLYANIAPNKRQLVDGLLWQAARLRVSLDILWDDIKEKGETELFRQGADEFKRERPESKVFTARDRAYASVIKQLNELLPAGGALSKLGMLDDDGED